MPDSPGSQWSASQQGRTLQDGLQLGFPDSLSHLPEDGDGEYHAGQGQGSARSTKSYGSLETRESTFANEAASMGDSLAMSQMTGIGGEASSFHAQDAESIALSVESEFEHANRMAEQQYLEKKAAQKKARRMARRPKPVSIPWRLLDELEAEKRKFQKENALRELTEESLRRAKERKFLPHLAAKRSAQK